MKGDYDRGLKHRATVQAKRERLDGLRKLYATYEQVGELPLPGSDMRRLRNKIASTHNQLRAMDGWDEVKLA